MYSGSYKLMNEIESEMDGEIVAILVEMQSLLNLELLYL